MSTPVKEPNGTCDALVDTQHLGLILRLAREYSWRYASPAWLRGHQHARLRAVDARLPRPFLGDRLAVLELRRVLAEVPDVAGGVLRVPVVGVLDQLAVLGDRVADDTRLDPRRHALGAVRDGDDDALNAAVAAGLAVDPAHARPHGPVRVVDDGRERARIELDRLGAGRQRARGGRSAAGGLASSPSDAQPASARPAARIRVVVRIVASIVGDERTLRALDESAVRLQAAAPGSVSETRAEPSGAAPDGAAPPCAWAMAATIARPRPVPLRRARRPRG